MVINVNSFTRARLNSVHTRDAIVCFLKTNDYNQRDFIRFLKKLKTTATHIFPHKSDSRKFCSIVLIIRDTFNTKANGIVFTSMQSRTTHGSQPDSNLESVFVVVVVGSAHDFEP